MNKINRLFSERGDRKLLSLYFCAGCPKLDMTADVILSLQSHGIDMIEEAFRSAILWQMDR